MAPIPLELGTCGSAVFSRDRRHRYVLTRDWGAPPGPLAMFLGLNPSVATAREDDPTVRKCWQWAREWGYSSFVMLNAYSYRVTDRHRLQSVSRPNRSDNDLFIRAYARAASLIVAAWGNGNGTARDDTRFLEVRQLLSSCATMPIHCLGLTKARNPRHPLYVARSTPPVRWM